MGLLFLPFFLFLAHKRQLLTKQWEWITTLLGVSVLFGSYLLKIWTASPLESIYFLAWPLIWIPSLVGFMRKLKRSSFDQLVIWWSGITSVLPLAQRLDLLYVELPSTLSLILLISVAFSYGRMEVNSAREPIS